MSSTHNHATGKAVRLRALSLGLIISFMGAFLSACQDHGSDPQSLNDSHIIEAEFSPKTHNKHHRISAFVQAVDQAQLAFQVSGRVSDQWVDIGQHVKPGDRLLAVYNPGLMPHIDAIEAQLKANRAELTQTESELTRNQSLSAIQAISQNQLDRLQSQVDQLKAQETRLQAQLQEALNNLQEATLSAPFAGEVADILVKPGTQVQAGQAVIVLSGSQIFEAPLYVSDALLKHLDINQNLTAVFGKQTFQVTIKEISRSANPNSQLFKVLVQLPPDTGLMAGQKIEVTLSEPMADIYQLPVSAVIDDGINEPYVFVRKTHGVQHQSVQVVHFYDNQIWVRIPQHKDKITIITAGQSTVTPAQQKSTP